MGTFVEAGGHSSSSMLEWIGSFATVYEVITMTRWEYKVTQVQFMLNPPFDAKKPKNAEAMDIFQKLGQHGWELVQAQPQQTGLTTCFWKREIKGKVDEWTT